MSNYVTTNIRIPEEDYIRLKEEAAEKRQSLSAVIREKIGTENTPNAEVVKKFMEGLEKIAGHNAKKLKHWDSLKALRQTRDEN